MKANATNEAYKRAKPKIEEVQRYLYMLRSGKGPGTGLRGLWHNPKHEAVSRLMAEYRRRWRNFDISSFEKKLISLYDMVQDVWETSVSVTYDRDPDYDLVINERMIGRAVQKFLRDSRLDFEIYYRIDSSAYYHRATVHIVRVLDEDTCARNGIYAWRILTVYESKIARRDGDHALGMRIAKFLFLPREEEDEDDMLESPYALPWSTWKYAFPEFVSDKVSWGTPPSSVVVLDGGGFRFESVQQQRRRRKRAMLRR